MASWSSPLCTRILDISSRIFFFDLGLSIYFFLFNLFLIGHGYTEKTLGLLTSAMAVGNLVGAIPAGRLAQRLGLRPVLLACFFLATVVFSARSLLFGLAWQISLAFIAGIALAAWAVCIPPTVAQLTDEQQRPLAFSLVFSLGIGVGAAGGLFGGRLPGWLGSHYAASHFLEPDQLVLLLSCCIVGVGIWPAAKLRLKRSPPPPLTTAFFSPFMLRYLPAIAAWSLVTGSFSPFANVYFKRHLHMTLPQIGNAFSISQIAQVGAVLTAPLIFKRFGLLAGIVYTQIVGAAPAIHSLSSEHPPRGSSGLHRIYDISVDERTRPLQSADEQRLTRRNVAERRHPTHLLSPSPRRLQQQLQARRFHASDIHRPCEALDYSHCWRQHSFGRYEIVRSRARCRYLRWRRNNQETPHRAKSAAPRSRQERYVAACSQSRTNCSCSNLAAVDEETRSILHTIPASPARNR